MPSPRMSDTEIWSFVRESTTGILTTLRRDGVPISLPLWFACLDRVVYMRTRGRKLQRVERDPRASFLVESGERWAELKAVHLTGRAELVSLDAELEARFTAELDRKYASLRGARRMPSATADYYRKVEGGVIRFTPDERILHWDNAKLSGER